MSARSAKANFNQPGAMHVSAPTPAGNRHAASGRRPFSAITGGRRGGGILSTVGRSIVLHKSLLAVISVTEKRPESNCKKPTPHAGGGGQARAKSDHRSAKVLGFDPEPIGHAPSPGL